MMFRDNMRVSVSISGSEPLKELLESTKLVLTLTKFPPRDTITFKFYVKIKYCNLVRFLNLLVKL